MKAFSTFGGFGGGMVKAIWAVACSILVVSGVLLFPMVSAVAGEEVEVISSGFSGAADSEYRLGPEDNLRISVWDNKELTLDLVVRPDGKISMPLIQDVIAEGLTTPQLAAEIKDRLSAYIVNPEVSVIVLQVNSPKYYIVGSVSKPGTYPLRGEVSVLQALALAGGFTQFASPRGIKLIRNVDGKQQIYKINYYKIIEDGGVGNYPLRSADTIVVP